MQPDRSHPTTMMLQAATLRKPSWQLHQHGRCSVTHWSINLGDCWDCWDVQAWVCKCWDVQECERMFELVMPHHMRNISRGTVSASAPRFWNDIALSLYFPQSQTWTQTLKKSRIPRWSVLSMTDATAMRRNTRFRPGWRKWICKLVLLKLMTFFFWRTLTEHFTHFRIASVEQTSLEISGNNTIPSSTTSL